MGSGIIFNGGSTGGGGTTINPQNNVIPVRLDATTFIDSNIENDPNNYLKTSVTPTSGYYFGLFIDFGNLISNLGDINYANGTKLSVDGVNQVIKTQDQGNDIGLNLDFANSVFTFGDYNNFFSGTSFIIDDSTQKMTFNTEFLNFVGASLINAAAVTPVGKNLLVTINGTQYHIPLYN